MPDPKKDSADNRFTFRLPPELRARLRARAAKDKVTESDIVRAVVERFLNGVTTWAGDKVD